MKKPKKPGDLFNAFQKKKKSTNSYDPNLGVGNAGMRRLIEGDKARETNAIKSSQSGIKGLSKLPMGNANSTKMYKKKKKKKSGLRPADVVVASEQNASHQFYKKTPKHKKSTKHCKYCGK